MSLIEDAVVSLTGMDSMLNKKHVHRDKVEIMYILKGKGTFLVDSKVFDIGQNMLIVIDSDTLHCSNHSIKQEYLRDRLLFDKKEFLKLLSLCDIDKESIMQKCFFLKESIHEYFVRLTKETDGITKIELLLKILKNCQNENKTDVTLIDKVLIYIDENLANTLNAEEISKSVHLSSSYLCHMFKKKTGFSLMEYVKHKRIMRAKALLEQDGLSVSEIAIACGYDNFSYFSRLFSLMTGLSPSRYRKQFNKGEYK